MKSKTRRQVKIVAITLGDPGGIGPEVTLKALAHTDIKKLTHRKNITFLLIGSPEIYLANAKRAKSCLKFNAVHCVDRKRLSSHTINMLDLADDPSEVEIGTVCLANAALSYHALEVGAYLAREKVVQALVTAPINKEAVQLMSPGFTGHTEYLARIAGVKQFAMLLIGGPLRVVVVTTHIPLAKVSTSITAAKIQSKIILVHDFLRRKVKIRVPTIGVAGLNPHAGEGGKMGREEISIITPAVKACWRKGVNVVGPFSADIIFHEAYEGRLDAVVAMYHDQGLGPLKMIGLHSGVNLTLGLPFIRTSPDHGTGFDIAYKNKANPGSMIQAIKTAIELI